MLYTRGGGREGGREGKEGKIRKSVSTNGTTVFKEQSRHVLCNNASRCLRRTTMVRNYIRRDVGQPDSRNHK